MCARASFKFGCVLSLLAYCTAAALAAEPDELFPFVLPWNDSSPSVTNVSGWLDKPAGRQGRVVVREGHLYTGDRRIRFFGVNLCFGADFPSHEEARQIAARMAKFGINCVRFHHMDMRPAPDGIFAADGKTLDPGQLDKLDYLIAQLKAHGIYADLNLHVSRSYPDLPRWEGMPEFSKGVDNFDPRMIDLQRDYARALLTHQNPYTGTRYTDEPAIAFIEINNENALLHEWWSGRLDAMPASYADQLKRYWNLRLGVKYPNNSAFERAWGAAAVPLGAEMLPNGEFAKELDGWNLEKHDTAQASGRTIDGPDGSRALQITVLHEGQEAWHVQLAHRGLSFEKGKPYTLRFQAKADAPRKLTVNAMQAHEPWQQFFSTEVSLGPEWQVYQFTFMPSARDTNARITFTGLASQTGSVAIAEVSLKPGGVLSLRQGESAGNIGIFLKRDFASRPEPAQRDWIMFLWELEHRYWTGMFRFIRGVVRAQSLVIGTQMGWSPFPIQAQLDVIDSHAYWQHPRFPGRPWDMNDWTVQNIPMAGAKDGGTLPRLALSRVAGKPFICTEYNHSAPNTYGSEAFLLLSSFAAMQDWDAIFAFAYSHRRGEWDLKRMGGFFDIDQHPGKMATLPAAVAMFVRGDVPSPPGRRVGLAAFDQVIDRVRQAGPYVGADAFGVGRLEALRRPVAVNLAGANRLPQPPDAKVSDAWTWRPDDKPVVTVNAERSKAVIGTMADGESFRLGDVRIAAGRTRQNWAAITLTAIDGPDLHSPGRILLTATGDVEDTDMKWKNPEKSSVGRDWGRAPSLVEGIHARVTLPVSASKARAWALDEVGKRKTSLPVQDDAGKAAVDLGPKYRTVWYEIEVQP